MFFYFKLEKKTPRFIGVYTDFDKQTRYWTLKTLLSQDTTQLLTYEGYKVDLKYRSIMTVVNER